MKAFGNVCAVILLSLVGILILGATLTQLWAWFVVATFHIPALSFVQAYGLCIVASVFTLPASVVRMEDKKTTFEQTLTRSVTIDLSYLMLLLMGFVVHICWY
jgi:hypothetical protein